MRGAWPCCCAAAAAASRSGAARGSRPPPKMAALSAERGYALSCGRLGRGTRLSLFHVKLTDSALRAFEAYQGGGGGGGGGKDSVGSKPSIQFQGNQGYISIPRPDCPSGVRTFSFYLSNLGKDNLQGSFDCIQQYISSNGNVQLDCLGAIQDKITVCATDESYQKAKQSMAQAEEETRSRGAIVIKTGAQYRGKTVKVRKPARAVSEAVPSRKHPTPVNLASAIKRGPSAVSLRPVRDRVVHLLALKPYKKPELLLRLQKDGLSPQDKDSLDGVLQQVANLSAKDNACTLKESLYKEVQRDWPGYSEGDQQLLKRTLFRKLCQAPNMAAAPPENPADSPTREHPAAASPPQKRPQIPDFVEPPSSKKQRISHFAQRTFNGKLGGPHGHGASATSAEATATAASTSLLPPLEPPRPHDPLSDVSNDLGHGAVADVEMAEPGERTATPPRPATTDSPATAGKRHGGLHAKAKKKAKKHKERDRKEKPPPRAARERPPCGRKGDGPGTGTSHGVAGLNGTYDSSGAPASTSEGGPDFLHIYGPISSPEQRQAYKNDFNAEYGEYRDLHARIERVTRRFVQLDGQLKQLAQGTEEYKTIHDQILQEYRKIKKTNPLYTQEKNRCEYLHNKLAHIKKLIAEYDQQQLQEWH